MIEVTESAAEKIKKILKEENAKNNNLRIYIEGGGCSGFKYGFALADEVETDDFDIESNGIHLLVDSISFQYLRGATLDFKRKLFESEFVLKNPNAKTSCGCGSSFTV
jgi:iron-sulfur cluster insertion protein